MKRLAESESLVLVSSSDIVTGLGALGLGRGDVAIVHASLSAFGVVPGGEQVVLQALREVVGQEGTLVMPAQSWQLCDPDFLDDPAYDAATRARIRDGLPVFDVDLTPTRSMGALAEVFRAQPTTRRSSHPHRSFAAQGPLAEHIVRTHPLQDPFGPGSPLDRLVELDAMAVLLGVGFDKCTALHHAELRAAGATGELVRNGARLDMEGGAQWCGWLEPKVSSGDFARVGDALESEPGAVAAVTIGRARCRAVRLGALVRFAEQWFSNERG
ncbi:aminoglycoside N(3)-acetyltransferase [Cellulosimicrobium cellulans]|uniref:aminoglycoside N(3)-acetyltransferase n=1 Tax=Cellulosimicrobium cellulans TaxID=1710 RepID=UPI0036E2F3C2